MESSIKQFISWKLERRKVNFKFPISSIQFLMTLILTSSFIHAQSLQNYLEIAEKNNPEIQKFELQYQISSEKVNEVNAIPNTEIGFGYFLSEPETRTGAQRAKLSIKQMMPWFGSITSRENYMSSLADAKFEDIVIAKRKLVASVSQSYYNLYSIKAKQEVFVENIALLKIYEILALTAVEIGKASAVNVLRLQMRQNELDQLKQVLEQEYLAERTLFNKLLNREKSTEVEVVNALTIPQNEDFIDYDNLKLHPELIKYDKIYESVTQSELLNQKSSAPMIGFGLDYIAVEKRPEMDFSDNGKDIFMPMVSLSIPIFNKKYKSQTKQNQLKQQEITFQKQGRLNRLETLLDKANNGRISAKISYNTQQKNLIQAKNAEEILMKSYETGTINFNDVLDIQELQLKFQINKIKAVQQYYLQTTIINYLSN